MDAAFRFALCNELFQGVSLRQTCEAVRRLGYAGLEIAPFTLADDPVALPRSARHEIRAIIAESGLSFAGLHWLLAAPAGMHVTTPDEALRRRSWNYLRHLVDLCADLAGNNAGHNGVMVFGSPKQRSTTGGIDREDAIRIFTAELARLAPHAEQHGVTILVEALPADQSDVINSLAEAVHIVKQIGNPAVQTMFDVHNAVNEDLAHADLLERYFPFIRHVHVNEVDGREPGSGSYDFAALLTRLDKLKYSGWISLEVFDFSRDAGEVASRALSHLKSSLPAATVSQTI
ncbi:MAG: sugar phosphate isomerase/epimerase [Acidobacteriaceae bacterium]|nr:sugar phosphate isomerase/epimerase [Acidobacteriaceae bacterium]